MKDRDKSLFSVENEVALHPERNPERPRAEDLPEARAEIRDSESCYYASTAFEPGVGDGASAEYLELLRLEQTRYPDAVLPFLSVLAGVAGGVFAIPAVILSQIAGMFSAVFMTAGVFILVVIGPFAEETLKQSGAIFQLEKMRGSIRYDWQFFLSGMIGGAVFSVLENLLYRYVYLATLTPEKLAAVMEFRWTICTALHILCPVISSLGLRHAWRESLAKERPCRISDAFPWFAAAAAVHGLYNASMLILDPFDL